MDTPNSIPSLKDKPLCLLSLDGGGIRGLSELLILKEMFHRLQKRINSEKAVLPADVFHMIGGTSTGGLITILLGRLRLSIDDALECYTRISRQVFIHRKMVWKDGKFKASQLERAIKDVIEDRLGKGHALDLIRFPSEDDYCCKSFVCAMASNHINKVPTMFRTWEASKDPGYNCQIWEAARATSAAPRLFKQIHIGHPGRQVAFSDGALGCNNPIKYVVSEALAEFGNGRQIACILSIGSGQHRHPGFDKPTTSQRLIPTDLIHVLARLATDSEEDSRAMAERFHDFPSVYQRLNPGLEVGCIKLYEWERLGDIEAHTAAYLRENTVQQQLENIVDSLLGFPSHQATLASIDQGCRRSPTPELNLYQRFPDLSADDFQHLHPQSMREIDFHFHKMELGSSSKTLVLYGMAGAGKSQLAVHYCRLAKACGSFGGVLWLDGSSESTVDNSLVSFAEKIRPDSLGSWTGSKARGEISTTMDQSSLPWLVVLDNYDEPAAYRMVDVLPKHSIAQLTLITSRSIDTRRLGTPIEIGQLPENEALSLLWGTTTNLNQRSQDDLLHGRAIVKRLGYLALAIAQASAYISDRHMCPRFFLQEYEDEQRRIHATLPTVWMYQRAHPLADRSVPSLSIGTTWELSLNILKGSPELREAKIKLLALSAFFGRTGISETPFSRYIENNADIPKWMRHFQRTQSKGFDGYAFREAITEMGRLCLLQQYQIRAQGTFWQFHPVVQDWAIHRHSPEECETFILLAVDIIQTSLSSVQSTWLLEADMPSPSCHNQLRPHVHGCYNNLQKFLSSNRKPSLPKSHQAALKLAKFFCCEGNYDTAQEIQRALLDELLPANPLWSITRRQLARTLFRKGAWVESARVQEDVVSRIIPGSETLDDAFQLTALAYMYQWPSQGISGHKPQTEKAFDLATRGYDVITQLQGNDSPAAASAMVVLAEISYHSKEYAKARALEERAVAIREACLGPENLSTVQTKNTLAVTLAKLGQFSEAERIHMSVRDFHMRQFGPCHPDTLEAERMLARDWRLGGRLAEARKLNEDILNRALSSFGESHYDTKQAANALWRCLIAQREVQMADKLQNLFQLKLKDVEVEDRLKALEELNMTMRG